MTAKSPQDTQGKSLRSLPILAFLSVAVPVLLTLLSARLVMTNTFLEFEYNRSGFPIDQYGFGQEERLHYSKLAIDYLFNEAGIDFLGDLTFSDGFPLFVERELRHMEDVKLVTTRAFQVLSVGCAFTALLGLVSRRIIGNWQTLRRGLILGSAITLGIIACVIVAVVIAWDFFFTTFHQIFFESGTWRFSYSDTLIRLFPQQFWFDAALTVGILTAIWAFILLGIAWQRNDPQHSGQL